MAVNWQRVETLVDKHRNLHSTISGLEEQRKIIDKEIQSLTVEAYRIQMEVQKKIWEDEA